MSRRRDTSASPKLTPVNNLKNNCELSFCFVFVSFVFLSVRYTHDEVTIGGFVGWGQQLVSFSNSDVSIVGEDTMDLAGSSLSSGCDLDGDGLDDLLVGAPGNDDGGSNSGRTYVIRGADIVQNSPLRTGLSSVPSVDMGFSDS